MKGIMSKDLQNHQTPMEIFKSLIEISIQKPPKASNLNGNLQLFSRNLHPKECTKANLSKVRRDKVNYNNKKYLTTTTPPKKKDIILGAFINLCRKKRVTILGYFINPSSTLCAGTSKQAATPSRKNKIMALEALILTIHAQLTSSAG